MFENFFYQLSIWANHPIGQFVIVFLILVLTHQAAKIARRLFSRESPIHRNVLSLTKTQRVVLKHMISLIIYLLGAGVAIYTIPSLRALSISLFAGAGVFAVIIGFASQQAFSNIISGIFIAIFTPFRVGDIIHLKDHDIGVVEDINLRHTTLRTFENKRIVVPNSTMNSETLVNYNIEDSKTCKFVEFGISYDSDIDLAMEIIADEVQNHPLNIDHRTAVEKKQNEPRVMVKVLGFSDFSVKIRAWAWAEDPYAAYRLGWDLNKSIKERFDKEGVEIPFPYRTVVYKKDLPKNAPKRGKKPISKKKRSKKR